MQISVFDLFKIGVGPSSSHTVGPMKAARLFVMDLLDRGLLPQVGRIQITLYGSLGATGKGHGTDKAIILGLEGEQPEHVVIDSLPDRLDNIRKNNQLCLLGQQMIPFHEGTDLKFVRQVLPYHPNGILLSAYDPSGVELHSGTYYSVGGGFVVFEGDIGSEQPEDASSPLPYPFNSSDELLGLCIKTGSVSASSCLPMNRFYAPNRKLRQVYGGYGRSCWEASSAVARPREPCRVV